MINIFATKMHFQEKNKNCNFDKVREGSTSTIFFAAKIVKIKIQLRMFRARYIMPTSFKNRFDVQWTLLHVIILGQR